MSGLMRRLTHGRAAADDEAGPPPPAASEPARAAADAHEGGSGLPAEGRTAGGPPDGATAVLETPPEAERPAAPDLPAGVDPAELAAAQDTSARRSQVRRRLRYLQAVRELLLRDLGGFVAEAHRSPQGLDAHRPLLEVKARRLETLDGEVRELEARLGRPYTGTVLRRPGVGGTCPACGELHGSEARFCSRCGTPLTAAAARLWPAPAPPAAPGEEPKATTASLWGRPKRPAADAPSPAEATRADEPTQADGGPAPERREPA
jgi:hypothetical protein